MLYTNNLHAKRLRYYLRCFFYLELSCMRDTIGELWFLFVRIYTHNSKTTGRYGCST